MQQPSVTDFFKVKKRVHDDSQIKSSKLLAVTPTPGSGTRDKPNAIRLSEHLASPEVATDKNVAEHRSGSIEIDRKTAVGKRRLPCYIRFQHLLPNRNQDDSGMSPTGNHDSTVPISSLETADASGSLIRRLPLPRKYDVIVEVFRAVETVAAILSNRNEMITLTKMKPAVLDLVRTTQLQEKHLGQFLTVFPNCYNYKWEKVKMPGSREVSYQLIMTPNLAISSVHPTAEKLNAALLAERKQIFEASVLEICHKHHKEFLSSLNPPIEIPPEKKVTRWHPKFKIHEVPDIEVAEIPKSPDAGSISASTAKDVIARAQNIMEAANPRMKKALHDLMVKSGGTDVTAKEPPSTSPTAPALSTPIVAPAQSLDRVAAKNAILKAQQALLRHANPKMRESLNKILSKQNQVAVPIPPVSAEKVTEQNTSTKTAPVSNEKGNPFNKKSLAALKGISQNLIDKIRVREKEKAIRSMTLAPEEAKRRAMLNRLPEFVKIVRNTMVAEKKSVLSLHIIVDRLSHSYHRSLSDSEVEAHVRLLRDTVPDWLTILNTTQGEFVRIAKDLNINEIVGNIEKIIEKTK